MYGDSMYGDLMYGDLMYGDFKMLGEPAASLPTNERLGPTKQSGAAEWTRSRPPKVLPSPDLTIFGGTEKSRIEGMETASHGFVPLVLVDLVQDQARRPSLGLGSPEGRDSGFGRALNTETAVYFLACCCWRRWAKV